MISQNLHVLQVGHMVGYHWSLASTIGFQASLIIFCTKPHSDFSLLQAWATFQSLISICAVLCLVIQSCLILRDPMDGIFATSMDSSPPVSSVHGDSPGKNTGVGCHFLLQGIFPPKGSDPGLLHCRRILYCLRNQGRPPPCLLQCYLKSPRYGNNLSARQ